MCRFGRHCPLLLNAPDVICVADAQKIPNANLQIVSLKSKASRAQKPSFCARLSKSVRKTRPFAHRFFPSMALPQASPTGSATELDGGAGRGEVA